MLTHPSRLQRLVQALSWWLRGIPVLLMAGCGPRYVIIIDGRGITEKEFNRWNAPAEPNTKIDVSGYRFPPGASTTECKPGECDGSRIPNYRCDDVHCWNTVVPN